MNAYTPAAALSALVLVPITNTNIKYNRETICEASLQNGPYGARKINWVYQFGFT